MSTIHAFAAVFLVTAGMSCFDLSSSPRVNAVTFLPDDAEIACRAILPQCFKRSDWAALCGGDPDFAEGHAVSCRAAGFEQGKPPQGR